MLKAVYGPVPSWRLGRSLGIDPICKRKVCSFDCVYCQLGKTTEKTIDRRIFVDTAKIRKDLEEIFKKAKGKADVVTISGTGEPELAENLGGIIELAREVTGMKIAVLTNSSLMGKEEVRKDLAKADIVIAKLDAGNSGTFRKVNNPHASVDFGRMIEGMKKFRDEFKGKYSLQMMFIDLNKNEAGEMRKIAEEIRADDIQIDTPLRKPSGAKPLGPEEMEKIKKAFEGMNYIYIYDSKKPSVEAVNRKETLERRPNERECHF